MKIGKILRYAVIGARYEAEKYCDMAIFHEEIDDVKSRYYQHMSDKTDEDVKELQKIFSQHSKSDIDFR